MQQIRSQNKVEDPTNRGRNKNPEKQSASEAGWRVGFGWFRERHGTEVSPVEKLVATICGMSHPASTRGLVRRSFVASISAKVRATRRRASGYSVRMSMIAAQSSPRSSP